MEIIEYENEFHVRIDFNSSRKRNTAAVKKIPSCKWDWKNKVWKISIHQRPNVLRLQQYCKAELFKITDTNSDEIERIPELPNLEMEIPLSHPEGFGFRPYQEKGVARGLELKRFLNGDEQGLGKAQPLYSKIATPNGWKTMGEMKVGKELFGLDGKIHKVNGVFPQGECDTYRVYFSDGFYADCNKDHIWTVRDANRRRRGQGFTNKTTDELIEIGLEYKTNAKRIAYGAKPILKWEIPTAQPMMFPEKEFVIHPYILGCLLGDGCMTQKPVCISIPDHQLTIKKEIEALLPGDLKLWKHSYPSCPQYYITQNKTTKPNPFKKEILSLGINLKSKKKFIPEVYLQGSIDQRIELLKGLMDTDGSAKKNRITFHTMSQKLAGDITELVQSLGGLAKIREYDRGEKGLEYQVNVKVDFIPFKLEDKINQCWEKARKLTSRYISKIEKIGKHQHQCISVSAPDSLYLTDNFIATHNTIQSISTIYGASLKGEDVFPCLVICPSSTKINWKREWEMWTDRKAMILETKLQSSWHRFHELGMSEVFITNYESLKKYFVKSMPSKRKDRKSKDIEMDSRIDLFKSVIIDESHRCKDVSTQQSQFTLRICHKKEWVICLTGTPVVNKPIDLYPQLAIMNRLGDFGGKKGYLKRYCEGGRGSANLKELNYLLNKNCFFRREKSEVAKDLPDKQRQTILCDISTRKKYNKARDEFVSYLKEQGCEDAEIAKKMRGEIMVKMAELKKISAYGKLNEAKEFIHQVIDSGEKLIVFVVHHVIVDELKKEFPKAVTVTGRDNADEKQASIDGFQNNSNTNLIICNIKAAGVGITLTASSRVAFIEYPWTYADCVQCEDRSHRIGQVNSVMCTYFLGQNTIDEQLYEMIQKKRHIGNAITGATDQMKMNMVDNIINLFK